MQKAFFDAGFKDAKFMSAKEKAQVLRAWETFLRNGCRQEDFTKALYAHLHLHCGYIAHFDIRGFYAEYFTSGQGTVDFLEYFEDENKRRLPWPAYSDYQDLTGAMLEVLAKYELLLTQQALKRQREADIAHARALLGKHGISLSKEVK